jgi:hypothetical protein
MRPSVPRRVGIMSSRLIMDDRYASDCRPSSSSSEDATECVKRINSMLRKARKENEIDIDSDSNDEFDIVYEKLGSRLGVLYYSHRNRQLSPHRVPSPKG